MAQAENLNTTSPSRRAVLTGATALATGTGVNLAAVTMSRGSAPDPIFSAIDRHRAAFIQQMVSANVRVHLIDNTPDHEAASAAFDGDYEISEAAALALTKTMPTTMAGVLALIAYAEEFNTGGVYLPADRRNWSSDPTGWPVDLDDPTVAVIVDDMDSANFAWFLLRNIRNALIALSGTVQS